MVGTKMKNVSLGCSDILYRLCMFITLVITTAGVVAQGEDIAIIELFYA